MEVKGFKGAIFDLDGTLLDSMHIWHDVDEEFFRRRGLKVSSEYVQIIKNMHLKAAAVYTKEKYNIKESVDEIVDEWLELCAQGYLNNVDLKPGAYEYLKSLHKNNIKLAFATASEKVVCEDTLKKHGIFDLFDSYAYVSEINIGKSEPDIYLLAAERIGLKAEDCIVFEDIIEGVKSAKKGGFAVCGVYDKSSEKDIDVIKENADYYIKSFEDILYK